MVTKLSDRPQYELWDQSKTDHFCSGPPALDHVTQIAIQLTKLNCLVLNRDKLTQGAVYEMETNRDIMIKHQILLLFIVSGECRLICVCQKCVCLEVLFLGTEQVKGLESEINHKRNITQRQNIKVVSHHRRVYILLKT